MVISKLLMIYISFQVLTHTKNDICVGVPNLKYLADTGGATSTHSHTDTHTNTNTHTGSVINNGEKD